MPEVDEAAIGTAGVMGGGTLIVSMLSAEAPLTGFPQRAFFNRMPRLVGTAPEAVRKLGFGSMSPLAQNSMVLQVILSWFYISWPLSGEDAWDVLIVGREESGCGRGRGVGNEQVLLKAGADGAGC